VTARLGVAVQGHRIEADRVLHMAADLEEEAREGILVAGIGWAEVDSNLAAADTDLGGHRVAAEGNPAVDIADSALAAVVGSNFAEDSAEAGSSLAAADTDLVAHRVAAEGNRAVDTAGSALAVAAGSNSAEDSVDKASLIVDIGLEQVVGTGDSPAADLDYTTCFERSHQETLRYLSERR
jgi:hypothetical protein